MQTLTRLQRCSTSDSIAKLQHPTESDGDLVLSWTDSALASHDADFELIFTGPITVEGGDGFELWAWDNIGNAAHVDAVVLDVSGLAASAGTVIAVR